ncbi:hypothetical protein [Aquimonas sp.]|jgi:antitoxin HicB|uniref:hypothetical protein n=1 Tax=Aquimonas sp. TaxID=1872588 RepID=UPI0037C0D303
MHTHALKYPALIERGADGISITFPDFPMVATSAESEDELTETLVDALDEAIAFTIDEELPLPPASKVDGAVDVLPSAEMALKAKLYAIVRSRAWSQAELARHLDINRADAHRLLDPRHSTRLDRMTSAFKRLGYDIIVALQDHTQSPVVRG